MSARSTALGVIRTRLQGILTDDGFNTDAGQLVFIGQAPVVGPDDPQAALAVIVGADVASYQGEKVVITLPVEIQAHVRADVTDPWLSVEALIADIKTALEIDHDLGGVLLRRGLVRGSTRPFDRESGSEFVGAGVAYELMFSELWGTP